MIANSKMVDTGWHKQGNELDPNLGQTEVTLVKVGQVFSKSQIKAQCMTECLVGTLARTNFLKIIAAI
jgi:hypothetical protein